MPNNGLIPKTISWKAAWANARFRHLVISGSVALVAILSTFPFFFQSIEKRTGAVLNDWILTWLPAIDFSIFIFVLIWASTLLLILRCYQDPRTFLYFLWSYSMLCLLRVGTISLFPLEPPPRLLPLADPIANIFYGAHFVTKDLFFSGHTATLFLMAFNFDKKPDRALAFLAAGAVALLLLIQHVHYSIDVLAAPVFALLVYWLGKRLLRSTFAEINRKAQ